jgi:hypothetical protein
MSPKTLYYIPQAFVLLDDGSKKEFAGITMFGESHDKQMMFQEVSGKGGLFKGNMGHPVPSNINEDQIPFYTKAMRDSPSFPKLAPEMKDKIIMEVPWSLNELKEYIAKLEKKMSVEASSGAHGNADTDQGDVFNKNMLLNKLDEKENEIKNLKSASKINQQL